MDCVKDFHVNSDNFCLVLLNGWLSFIGFGECLSHKLINHHVSYEHSVSLLPYPRVILVNVLEDLGDLYPSLLWRESSFDEPRNIVAHIIESGLYHQLWGRL